MTGDAAPALRAANISKTFPGGLALDNVTLEIAPGEVHGLVGGNGSGKSTLIKILAGVYSADSGDGEVEINGTVTPVSGLSPDWAREVGLHFVHQDPAVFPLLTVAENMAIGRGFPTTGPWWIKSRALKRRTQQVLDRYEIKVRPNEMVQDLSSSQRTMVAIARALQDQTETSGGLLVLDEPTASLPGPEVDTLLDALRVFANSGQSILFVSHRTPEVLGFSDRVTVLRDGKYIDTVSSTGLTEGRLVELIVGRKLEPLDRGVAQSSGSDEAVMHVRGLYGGKLNGVTVDVRKGEVLGVAGLVGSGRTELLKSMFGAYKFDQGILLLDGNPVKFDSVSEAMDAGIGYVPEDRGSEASFAGMTVRENLSAASLSTYFKGMRLRHRRERTDARELIKEYHVVTSGDAQTFSTLSGGNQQKVILARWLRRKPRILLLDEPTHGVDIGARTQIYGLIEKAADAGTAIVLVSSDFEELALLSDRVVILTEGRVSLEIQGPGIDQDRIGEMVISPSAGAGQGEPVEVEQGEVGA